MKKFLVVLTVVLLVAVQSVAACTIFAVGKNATVDGSTMTSHTCDSTGDDLRLWVIPSMEAGTERDVVLNGRSGADYSQFPEVKDYGTSGMVLDTYTFTEDSNQYLHGMYSFVNDKGLAMGESTCSYDRNSEQGQKVRAAFSGIEGIYDCYMLQDLALEVCSTAREAVEFMGAMISEYGWNGATECINICDGEEAWVLEAYGGHIWVAARVPDDQVFVAANRARINFFVEDDPANYLYADGIKEFAIENGLWDGEGDFIPCYTFCPYPYRPYSTRREWRAMTLLDPSLDLDPYEQDPDHNWPCFVTPAEKVSVQTIFEICGDYYAGTEFDISETIWGGQFGDPLNPAQNSNQRAINSYRCTYIQIANIKSWLPDEVKCLVYYGYGAPSVSYLTPVFASVSSLPASFGTGLRSEYDPESGWWNEALVQQLSRINYTSAIEVVKEARDEKMAEQYVITDAVQAAAAKMVRNGEADLAVELLTDYTAQQANMWFDTYQELTGKLITRYMHGNIGMSTRVTYTDFWTELQNLDWVKENSDWQ